MRAVAGETHVAHGDWPREAGPYVDAMRMAIVPDASQQLAQFTGGNLDEIGATVNQQFNAFDIDREEFYAISGGLLWLVFSFAGALIVNRSFSRELPNDCLDVLISSPAPAWSLSLAFSVARAPDPSPSPARSPAPR